MLEAGEYQAKPISWGLERVEKLQAWKAVIQFQIKDSEETIKWDGFLYKRDGEVNKKTIDTITACGFKGRTLTDLNKENSLDKDGEVILTVIKEDKYLRVEWVNKKRAIQKATMEELKGVDFSKFDAALNKALQKTGIPNRAPGSQPPKIDDDEQIPF